MTRNLRREPERAPVPLGSVLRDPVREASIARMWRAIAAKRYAQQARFRHGMAVAVAVVAVAAASLFVSQRLLRDPSAARATPGALLRKSGNALTPVEVPAGGVRERLALADGSEIVVEPGGRLEPLASSGSELVLRLAKGSSSFHVQPGGPRRWSVEAGMARIEVVGTRFAVSRSAGGVRVEVQQGTVLVRSSHLADGVVRLEGGAALDIGAPLGDVGAPLASVSAPPGAPAASVAPPVAAPAASGVAASSTPSVVASSGGASRAWQAAAREGEHDEAYRLLGAGGLQQEVSRASSSEALFSLADIARLSGHPEQAVEPLRRLLRLYPSSANAALARITLARVESTLGHHERAARELELALQHGLPAGLDEDARARLAEAHFRAANYAAAERAVAGYLERYPNGHAASRLKRQRDGDERPDPAARP